MENLTTLRLVSFEDSLPLLEQPEELRLRASRDGFLFFRGLLCEKVVTQLRSCVVEFARRVDWLDPAAPNDEVRAAPGKRIGFYQDPEWVDLQVHVQNRPEMWALGDSLAIHAALRAVDRRSSYLFLSTANTCRVFSPHADMATQPHQDAHYVRLIEDFWTAWIPLEDCPVELGPLALLAGSHLSGLREHADRGQGVVEGGVAVPQESVWSTTNFRCGDAVLFRPHTLHRSLPNRSGNRLRMSVDFRYGFWSESAAVDWRAASIGK